MILHSNRVLFQELIGASAKKLNLPFLYVEKDYWVTYILKQLSISEYHDKAIFKGGTSLSKAYKIIERFSEDIDLAVITNTLNSNQIKKLIINIEKTILDTNFTELAHHPQVSKGSEFRKTVHNYVKLEEGDFGHALENVILELNSFAEPHPYETKEISTYICDFLLENTSTLIKEYELEPFNVNVLNYKRTFCEKISAIARASYESDSEQTQLKEKIRHFYDIYFLMSENDISSFLKSNEFIEMIKNVRADDKRQFNQNNWSTVLLSSTTIFTDTDDTLNQLETFYQTDFKDLVYTDDLPQMKDIKASIKEIALILVKEEL